MFPLKIYSNLKVSVSKVKILQANNSWFDNESAISLCMLDSLYDRYPSTNYFSVICWFYATSTFQDLISRLTGLDYMDNHVVFSQFTQWIRMPSKSEMACQKSSHRILFSGPWLDLLWIWYILWITTKCPTHPPTPPPLGGGRHFVVIHIQINFSHI